MRLPATQHRLMKMPRAPMVSIREVLRVQRGEADDDLRADREAEQEQKDADGPREHLIGDLDDEGLPAEEETHGNPEDKTTHFHDHEAISPLSVRKS